MDDGHGNCNAFPLIHSLSPHVVRAINYPLNWAVSDSGGGRRRPCKCPLSSVTLNLQLYALISEQSSVWSTDSEHSRGWSAFTLYLPSSSSAVCPLQSSLMSACVCCLKNRVKDILSRLRRFHCIVSTDKRRHFHGRTTHCLDNRQWRGLFGNGYSSYFVADDDQRNLNPKTVR